jgi:DNA-directed RNA polymerase subunit alpha
MTLGNALRRVLLSSLQGAAVTAVQIDGVLHEFSSIPGVREDVTDIVLNVKQSRCAARRRPKRMVLHRDRPGRSHRRPDRDRRRHRDPQPRHVLCTLDEGAKISMELTVDMRQGLRARPSEPSRRRADRPDPGGCALLSPVRKVSYRVENTRVGQIPTTTSSSMTIETDGTVSPEDAVALAARILQDQLQSSSTSTSREARVEDESASPTCPSTATCCARSTSSNCRSARPTA